MFEEPKPDMGGPAESPEEEMTKEERAMLWDDAMHYLEVLKNKTKGMKDLVVNQVELEGMSLKHYLNDIETDAGSMQVLFEGLKKNKLPKID